MPELQRMFKRLQRVMEWVMPVGYRECLKVSQRVMEWALPVGYRGFLKGSQRVMEWFMPGLQRIFKEITNINGMGYA